MKMLFAPDSFKGTMSSEHIIELLSQAAKKYFKDCEIIGVPMADGGEGTIDALVSVMKGRYESLKVIGPMEEPTEARYGAIGDDTVIIEMAEASGLTLVPENKRNPLEATSYGTGELIKHVLDRGYKNIFLTVGGSATNDGGMGAADALGIQFFDKEGKRLKPIGKNLIKIDRIQTEAMIPGLKDANITIMCDVKNPLVGKDGATYVYGEQKGGTPDQLELLEEGMKHYAAIMKEQFGKEISTRQGAGAAGGICVPFITFTKARIASGIETVLQIINFDTLLDGVDLVVTGEGRVDWQSAFGKVLAGVGNACKARSIPVIAIVGSMGDGAFDIFDYGVDSIMTSVNGVMDLDTAINNADELLKNAAERMFRLIKVGMKLAGSI